MIEFIFVLYCVAGCEQSYPSHRIIYAYDTIELCQETKEKNEALAGVVQSCERVSLLRAKHQ
jgi:hypothetical protein